MNNDRSNIMKLFVTMNKLRARMMYLQVQQLGLTTPQLFILRELFLDQPKTIGDLSKALELSNSTVTGIIDRLERDGLVERTRDDKDRRVVWISATATCQRMKEQFIAHEQEELREELMRHFSQEQFDLVGSMLETLIDYLEKKLEGRP